MHVLGRERKEEMGEDAETVLNLLLDYTEDYLQYNVDLIGGTNENVRQLLNDIGELNSFVKVKQWTNESNDSEYVENLANIIREVIFQAEETAEKYIVYESRQHLGRGRSNNFPGFDYSGELRRVGEECLKAREKIQNLYQGGVPIAMNAIGHEKSSDGSSQKNRIKIPLISEMDPTCVDSLLVALPRLEERYSQSALTFHMKSQIKQLSGELQFLQLYIGFLRKYNEAMVRKDNQLASIRNAHISSRIRKARTRLYVSVLDSFDTEEFPNDFEISVSELLCKIDTCKSEIKTICLDLMDVPSDPKFSSPQLHKFNKCLYSSLSNLETDCCIGNQKKLIELLKRKSGLLETIFDFAERCFCNRKDLNAMRTLIQSWAHSAACVSILCWVVGRKDEQVLCQLKAAICDLLPCTASDIGVFLGVLKASQPSFPHRMLMGEAVFNLVDFLLQNGPGGLTEDESASQAFRSELVFLILFHCEATKSNKCGGDGNTVLKLVEEGIKDFVCFVSFNGYKDERRNLVGILLENVRRLKASVKRIPVQDVESAVVKFPSTNVLGFIDFILESWNELLKGEKIRVPFGKNQVVIMNVELSSYRQTVEYLLELKKKRPNELELQRVQVANVAYKAKIAMISFLFMDDYPLWYNLMCFSDLVNEIKLIKSEVRKNIHQQLHEAEVAGGELNYSKPLPLSNDIMGLKHDEDAVVDKLLRGSTRRSLVSIVGIPGIGKTTLARGVYLNLTIVRHFHCCAWCSVSRVFTSKRMLFDILTNLSTRKEDMLEWDEMKLGQEIYRRLKGQRYLLVLDDIWDIALWAKIKHFLPDDSVGSRILLTTRIHTLAWDPSRSLYPLHLLSVEQGWELLGQKLCLKDDISQDFAEVGKQIVRRCKGLPLAIVKAAGLIHKELDNLDWWKIIARSLIELTVMEEFKALVSPSYAHLPEYLKPCFLYFGAFQRGKVIRSKKLIQLWISEGFVVKHELKSPEDVATDYLMELSDRSLVILGGRSSDGSIKTCQVHDFLYDFCLHQIREESFLQAVHGDASTHNLSSALFHHHRLSLKGKDWRYVFSSMPSTPRVQSMVLSSDSTFDPCKSPSDFPLGNFKYLQVFDMEEVTWVGEFPADITKLILLRYLAIQCSTRSITPQISRLEYLEVLWIKGNKREVQLPDTIWELKNLRHVEVGRCSAPFSATNYLLPNLSTFSSLSLSRNKGAEKILSRIPGVRKLRCRFHESWNQGKNSNEFPELQVLKHLESLNVSYVGKALFPCELSFPQTLKKLTLSNFRLPWSFMSVIGRELPMLKVLKLLENAFSGESWDMEEDGFFSLKFLKLYKLDIVQWSAGYDNFPCLEQLVVQECQHLEEIPCFAEISTLGVIQIKWCSPGAEASAAQIHEEQLDMGNDELQLDSTGYQLDDDYNISELWKE